MGFDVDWVNVDMSLSKKDLPKPLRCQSGGFFWVIMDSGMHGVKTYPAWWTGEKFLECNNEIITHFARMDFPNRPIKEA
jgi:hypothetical protein